MGKEGKIKIGVVVKLVGLVGFLEEIFSFFFFWIWGLGKGYYSFVEFFLVGKEIIVIRFLEYFIRRVWFWLGSRYFYNFRVLVF